MNNEKLLSKIKILSRASLMGIIAYMLLFVFTVSAKVKESFMEGWNSAGSGGKTAADPEAWKILAAFPFTIALISSLLIIVVSGIQLLFRLSKGDSPFNEKNCRSIKNIGISCIVFDVSKTIFYLLTDGSMSLSLLWLIGLVICAFYLIFRYGTILQQESDETL